MKALVSEMEALFATFISDMETMIDLSGPVMKFYDGTPPATLLIADTGTLIVTLSGGTPIFQSIGPSNLECFFRASNFSGLVTNNGTPTYARMYDNAFNAVLQWTVGTGSEEIILSSAPLSIGQTVTLDTMEIFWTIT